MWAEGPAFFVRIQPLIIFWFKEWNVFSKSYGDGRPQKLCDSSLTHPKNQISDADIWMNVPQYISCH